MERLATETKYQESFVAELGTFQSKVRKVIVMLEAIATGSSFNAEKLAGLVKLVNTTSAQHEQHLSHAERFGFASAPSRSSGSSARGSGTTRKGASKAKATRKAGQKAGVKPESE